MDSAQLASVAVDFDAFWNWVRQHPNCVAEAGTEFVTLFDHDLAHWVFMEDDHRRPVVQLMLGKVLMGELVLDVRDVLFVQSVPPEHEDGPVIFEIMAGPSEQATVAYRFVMQHGMEEVGSHHLGEAQ